MCPSDSRRKQKKISLYFCAPRARVPCEASDILHPFGIVFRNFNDFPLGTTQETRGIIYLASGYKYHTQIVQRFIAFSLIDLILCIVRCPIKIPPGHDRSTIYILSATEMHESYAPKRQSRLRSLTACLSTFRTKSRYDQSSASAASTVNAAWASLPGLPGPVMFGFKFTSNKANSASFPALAVGHKNHRKYSRTRT